MNGWVSGEYLGVPHVSSIHKTSDGGNTWQTQNFGTDEYLTDIYFVDNMNGWAVGGTIGGSGGNQHTTILHTTDGGANWQIQNPPSTSTLLGVNFVDVNDGWAVGVDGTVLTTSNPLTIEPPSLTPSPSRFTLSQNYPNPFNPTTTIEYSIPERELVQLKVYNVLGQEVKTLVNSYEKPGTYKINFDASDLSTGIYYYRIEAGDYKQVRKMILIR
jgi:hypothetical protein